MRIVVVDTDVGSFIFKNDSRSILYEPHLAKRELVISFMTMAELRFWAIQRNWGIQNNSGWKNTCNRWAEIIAAARQRGTTIATADAWIAATALLHNIPLITRNRKHYEGVAALKIVSEAAS